MHPVPAAVHNHDVPDADNLRIMALAHPGASEAPHHGVPSFRIRGRIFATLPDSDHAHVMASEPAIRAAAQSHPGCCAEHWWGKRLACVRVTLDAIPDSLLCDLLADARRHKGRR